MNVAHSLGPMNVAYYSFRISFVTISCPHCNALHWIEERVRGSTKQDPEFSMCCSKGAVTLPIANDTPGSLRILLTETRVNANGKIICTDRTAHFQPNIRSYNNAIFFNGNAIGDVYETPRALYSAAPHGNEATVQLLLESGTQVNVAGGRYGTALQVAALSGNEVVVKRLLHAGADVNATKGVESTALQVAALAGNVSVVQILLEFGADVNASGGDDYTLCILRYWKERKETR
jgi:hypothetical protein